MYATDAAKIEAMVAERFAAFDSTPPHMKSTMIELLARIVRDQERRLVELELKARTD